MRVRELRAWCATALALVFVAGCASRSLDAAHTSPSGASSAPVARDARVVGWWQLTTVYRTGRDPLQPDELSPEFLRFRPDGRFMTAGEKCTPPRYAAADGRLHLRWPNRFECFSFSSGDPTSLQISKALDAVQMKDEISYAIDGPRLTLSAGDYRIDFHHVDHPGPPTISLPETWPPSTTPGAPSSPSR